MKINNHLLIICLACGLLTSCGLFGNDTAPEIKSATVGLLFSVDSVWNYTTNSNYHGDIYGMTTRGDTLLVIGDGSLYMAPPGQALQKVHGALWENWNNGVTTWDSVCPGFRPGFVGVRDSLFLSDESGIVWKIDSIGGPIRYWYTNPNAAYSRAYWVGWLGGAAYKLYANGYLYPAYDQSGSGYTNMEWSPAIVGDSIYFLGAGDSIWLMTSKNQNRELIRNIASDQGRLFNCNGSLCIIIPQIENSKPGIYKYLGSDQWTTLAYSSEAKAHMDDVDLYAWYMNVQYSGVTIMAGPQGFALIRNDSLFFRKMEGGGDISPLFDTYSVAVWDSFVVFPGWLGRVHSIPLADVLSWN